MNSGKIVICISTNNIKQLQQINAAYERFSKTEFIPPVIWGAYLRIGQF